MPMPILTAARRAALKRKHGHHCCGCCGKPVRATKYSLKADGWHWHRKCWKNFCGLR